MIGQLNPTQLSSRLASMSDQQLQQYAAMHQDDPFVISIALDVKNQRDALRNSVAAPPAANPTVVQQMIARMAQLPPMQGGRGQQMPAQQLAQPPAPQQPQAPAQPQAPMLPQPTAQAAGGGLMRGIAKLPARNIARMADGGIAGYADGGPPMSPGMFDFAQRSEPVIRVASGGVPGYAPGGVPASDPKQAFAMQYKDLAEKVGAELGVDPGLIIAQWGLESGWGEKTIGDYNFGNIKDRMGKGPRARDKAEGSYDAYREYKSPEAFAADYVAQIKRNWPGAMGAGRDAAKFAEGLQQGRLGAYATAPNYGAALANTFSSLLPSAQAATRQAPTSTPAGQIPGAAPGQVAPPSTSPERAGADRELYTLGGFPVEHVFKGIPETALTMASGLFAPAIGALKTGVDYATTGRSEGLEKNAAESVYVPRSEAGRRQVEGIAQIAEAMKLPPYIPALGGTMSAARAARAAQAATAADEAAALASSSAAKVAAPRVAPPSAAGTTAAREASLQRARLAELQRDQAAAQAAQATAGSTAQEAAAARIGVERARANAAYGAGVADRAGLAGLMGAGTQAAAGSPAFAESTAPSAAATPPRPSSDLEQAKMREANEMPSGISPAQAAKAVDVAKQAIPPERRKGYDWEDLLTFGLALMAGNSPYATRNIGEAGIAALKGKQEREKFEREDLYRAAMTAHAQAQAKQAEALATKYGAETDVLKTGSSKIALATKAADTAFDNYMAALKSNPMQAMKATPESMNAIRLQLLHDAYKQYGLDTSTLPSSTSGAAKANFVFNPQTGKIE